MHIRRLLFAMLWPVVSSVVLAGDLDLQPKLRRPVALAVSSDSHWLYAANRDSGTISVIDTRKRSVAEELSVGGRLTDLALLDDAHLVTLDERNHQLVLLSQGGDGWEVAHRLDVADYPARLVVDTVTNSCLITSLWSRTVTVVKLEQNRKSAPKPVVVRTLRLPFEPGEICLAAQHRRLIVASLFGNQLAVVDTDQLQVTTTKRLLGHNIGGLAIDRKQQHLWLTQQDLNRHARSTRDDVHWGNMISNLLVSLRLEDVFDPAADGTEHREVRYLGLPGNAAGDPGRILISPQGQLAVLFSGVNEIAFAEDEGNYLFHRVPVERRPRAAISTPAGTTFVANMFSDSVSLVSVKSETAEHISLGPQPQLTPADQGEILFFDSRLSHDGWMSCHSCHTEGHSNGQLNDNLSDGSFNASKRVLSLLGVEQTGPWAWNGAMKTLEDQVTSSILNTMQGVEPQDKQVTALVAYLKTLPAPPPLSPASESARAETDLGRELFQKLDCSRCHTPPTYTSPRAYDVGLADAVGNRTYNPPSLRGVGRRTAFFHDARATSLQDVFAQHKHQLGQELGASELEALIRFLESL